MNSVDFSGLGKRIAELLRLGPEGTIELSLTRGGQVLISKSEAE
jgi:hypothetical protein